MEHAIHPPIWPSSETFLGGGDGNFVPLPLFRELARPSIVGEGIKSIVGIRAGCVVVFGGDRDVYF